MKKLLIPLIILFMLSGCANSKLSAFSRVIDEMVVVRTIGVDAKDEGVELTVLGNSDDEEPHVISNSADTISLAISQMQTMSDKHLFYGHLEQFIIGEEAAEQGILQYLDFAERDTDMRMSINVYVTKDSTAKELIEAGGGEILLPDLLNYLKQADRFTSGVNHITISDTASSIAYGESTLIPALVISEDENIPVEVEGYAVIREGSLAGWLDEEQTKGVSIILDQICCTDILEVKSLDGVETALKIRGGSVEVSPDGEGVKIEAKMEADINEVRGEVDILNQKEVDNFKKQADEIEKTRMEAAVEAAKEMKADFLRIYTRLWRKEPEKYRNMSEDFYDTISDIPVEITADVTIRRSYNLNSQENQETVQK